MPRESETTPTRRTVLSSIGTGLAAGLLGSETSAAHDASQYAVVQGDTCVAVRPVRGQLTAEMFYEYHLPEEYVAEANGAVAGDSQQYSSAGTMDLQRAKTSIAFLYQGPKGLSFFVVHGSASASDGGSVSFRLSNVPSGAEWVVRDDYYGDIDSGDLKNFDRWKTDGTDHVIDWTWGSSGTDGGVLRGLGEDFEMVVRPAFNDAAALYGEHYEGTVTDWQFLSGGAGVSKRVSLDLDQPIRIRTGGCDAGSGGTNQQSGSREKNEEEQERKEEKREEKQERKKEKNSEGRGKGHEKGRGKGHGKGRGKGHEKGHGKGHDREEDDDDDDDDEDDQK